MTVAWKHYKYTGACKGSLKILMKAQMIQFNILISSFNLKVFMSVCNRVALLYTLTNICGIKKSL